MYFKGRCYKLSRIFKQNDIWFLYLNHEACLDSNDKSLTRLKERLQVLNYVKQLMHFPHNGQVK